MDPLPDEELPSLVSGYAWAAKVMSAATLGVIPPGLGYWADTRWGTFPWCTAAGGVFGFVLLMWEVWKIAQERMRK